MIKIAIVEDEVLYADQLQEYLKKYEEEYRETFEISVFQDGDQIVHHYKAEYDVILMDVEMRFTDGMSAAEEIRKMDTEVVIIFITNMPQYAVRGYEVDALDYVLKPITYFAFAQRLNRAIERIKKRTKRVISVNIKGSQIRMPIESVYYIESQGHTLIFHGVNGEVEAPGTMKEIQEKLRDEHFFRGNKGYLINLAHVDRVVEGCAVVAGEELVLSRGRRKEFMEALAGYWGEAVR